MSAYQSINQRKDEFRKYLERNGVVDAITKVLVSLYEEPERPANPLEYIRDYFSKAVPQDGKSAAPNGQAKEEGEEK